MQITIRQLIHNVFRNRNTLVFRLLRDDQWVTVELRVARHPAPLHGLNQGIRRGLIPHGAAIRQRAGHAGSLRIVIPPLVRGEVIEPGGNHLPRRPRPVRGKRILRPPVHGPQLLLAHIVGPTAAIHPLGAAHAGQRQKRPVGGIRVEIVVHARTHDDLRTTLRINGVASELRGDTDGLRRRHPGQLFLPGRRAHLVGIVEVLRPGAWQIELLPVHPIVRQHHVEHRGDQVPIVVHDRHATVHDPRPHGAFLITLIVRQVEPRQEQFHGFLRPGFSHRHDRIHIIQVQVPLAHTLFTVAVSQGAARVHNRAVLLHHQQPVGGIGAVLQRRVGDIRRGEELARGVGAVAPIIQGDEERRVREPPHIVQEERFLLAHMEFR